MMDFVRTTRRARLPLLDWALASLELPLRRHRGGHGGDIEGYHSAW